MESNIYTESDLEEKVRNLRNDLKDMKRSLKEGIEIVLNLNNIEIPIRSRNVNTVGMSNSDISLEDKYELFCATRLKDSRAREKSPDVFKYQTEASIDKKTYEHSNIKLEQIIFNSHDEEDTHLREWIRLLRENLKLMKRNLKRDIESILKFLNIEITSENKASVTHAVGMTKSDISLEEKYELFCASMQKHLSTKTKSKSLQISQDQMRMDAGCENTLANQGTWSSDENMSIKVHEPCLFSSDTTSENVENLSNSSSSNNISSHKEQKTIPHSMKTYYSDQLIIGSAPKVNLTASAANSKDFPCAQKCRSNLYHDEQCSKRNADTDIFYRKKLQEENIIQCSSHSLMHSMKNDAYLFAGGEPALNLLDSESINGDCNVKMSYHSNSCHQQTSEENDIPEDELEKILNISSISVNNSIKGNEETKVSVHLMKSSDNIRKREEIIISDINKYCDNTLKYHSNPDHQSHYMKKYDEIGGFYSEKMPEAVREKKFNIPSSSINNLINNNKQPKVSAYSMKTKDEPEVNLKTHLVTDKDYDLKISRHSNFCHHHHYKKKYDEIGGFYS